MSMDFKKFHNKILVHMKTFDVTIDHILVHFIGSKLGLYVSFRIPLYICNTKDDFKTCTDRLKTSLCNTGYRYMFVQTHLRKIQIGQYAVDLV